jgi:predicted GNAT family acetyltransferase
VTSRSSSRVQRYETAPAFLAAAGDFLGRREAEHNLMFGIASNLTADPGLSAGPPLLATVSQRGAVVAAALMTPPWNIVLSCTDRPEAWAALVKDLVAKDTVVHGVTAPVESAAAFASQWTAVHDVVPERAMAERIYRLERVIPPTAVSGGMRLGTTFDRDLLVSWVNAFLVEALEPRNPEEAAVLVDRSFRAGTRTWYLWEDGGRPVSVAATGGPTPHGIRVGPVYTPPEVRGHGYASAVTAAASQAELDKGRTFVFLFTDLENPTSNRIYQQIGYEPVIDVDQIAFRGKAAAEPAQALA